MSSDKAGDWACSDFGRVMGPYLDAELDAATLVDAEHHVATCDTCRERVHLTRAMRGTLKRVVKTAGGDDLRARMRMAMTAESTRQSSTRERDARRAARSRWVSTFRTTAPLAAAAAVGLFVYGSRGHMSGNQLMTLGGTLQSSGRDDLLGELVAMHSRPLPYDATDPKKVRSLEKYVGVPISAHAGPFEKTGARFVGGRVLPVRQERAAMLQYEIGAGDSARRVSVFVFDPRRIQVNNADLSPRAVGTASVRVGRAQGYSVAVTERGGVGYAVASDLEPDRSAEIAALMEQAGTED